MADKSDDYVFHIPGAVGSVVNYLTPRGHVCETLGLTAMAMPPGRVDVRLEVDRIGLNVLPFGPDEITRFRFCGRNEIATADLGARQIFYSPGDLDLVCRNPNWEYLVEIDPKAATSLAAEALDGLAVFDGELRAGQDPEIAQLAVLSIRHLRFGPPDPLYVQGLAIAMLARTLTPPCREVSTKGTAPRIARAIDHIEAHLGDNLSVAEIAAVAAMSPSWFQSAFRTTMGQPVFAYIRERRLERARILLADQRLSLSQIAHKSGFSGHSHMTRLFRARYGISPKEMR
ncbi:helix-turn-helix domain-containing protein [Litoreibacter roseus]|uniref:HTH araC/xylS-type domain-containing protein n=1 Tax=Litoreibacter roseus TaxID=2601869 RepID=A0A6N6JCL5_9RHOB|nr:AraC family transcriptional regulator [Litoreibacter roseus]GFE63159.1 hypothetical protein KIN_02330 [Litoreibacter roseus]